jgi:signal transduction histidine kinase
MFKRSLAFRLLCLSAAAATLPALVIAIVLRTISSRALESSIQQNQMEIAQRVADEVNGEIRYAQGLLAFVARMPAVVSGNYLETQHALQNLLRSLPSVQEVMAVLDSGEERVKVGRRGAAGRLIKRTLNIHDRSVGAPFFSGNRLPTVLITEPIKSAPGMPVSTALVAKLSFSSLGSLIEEARVGQRGMAFVVDRHGALLAHIDPARVRAHTNMAQTPVVQDWLAHPERATGVHEFVDATGTPVIALAYPIPLLQSAVVVQQPRSDVYAPLRRMRWQFIAWTTLSVGLFLGLTVLIAWRIQQPLRQLQRAAEHITEGKMDVQLNIHTGDELEELGKAFSRMAEALRHLEVMRRDLISMIVHDLKSPLSSMLASVDYLLTNSAGPLAPDQRKFLAIAHRSGADLLTLIQNLLDVAKLEEGRLVLNKETFIPAAWAEEVLSAFRPVAAAGKKKISLSVSGDVPPVVGDRALLSRVLSNLVSNALRHTPLTIGEVVVALVPRKDQLSVEVRDNGQGIPQEYQTRIFEKFVQVERRRAHLRTGTGLGLTFCKMVVEAHGGRIFVNSVPDQGSTFIFLLPWSASTHGNGEPAEIAAPAELAPTKA